MLKAVTEVRLVEGERVNEGRLVDRLIEKLYFDTITLFVRSALPGIGYEAPPSEEIKWSYGDRTVALDEITANAMRLAFHEAGNPDARLDLPFTAAYVADKIIRWLRDGAVIPDWPAEIASNAWDFPMHASQDAAIGVAVVFYDPKDPGPPMTLHTTGDSSRPLPTAESFVVVHDISGTFHGTVDAVTAAKNGRDIVIVARLSDLPLIEA